MSEHLIPTVITDKNGKITTVRKRQEPRSSASKALGAAAPSITPVEASDRCTATPIVEPAPLTLGELEEFDKKYAQILSNRPYDGYETSREVFNNMLDKTSQAQVRRMLNEGTISIETLDRVLIHYRRDIKSKQKMKLHITKEKSEEILQTTLLLAEKIAKEHPTLPLGDGITYSDFLGQVVNGYAYRTKRTDRPSFTKPQTVEELDSLTAVAALTLHDFRIHSYGTEVSNKTVFKDKTGADVEGRYLNNRSLDEFLREHPEEAHRVIQYFDTREVGNTKKDTTDMIRHLEETADMSAVSDGWL